MEIKFQTADTIPFWERLSTGCDNINSITKGGIPFNGITEIYGESGVGKTQFCLQLALMAQMPKHLNGKEQCVVYICTEDVFPSKRFNQLTKEFQTEYNLNHIDFEDNLFLQHVNDFNQLKTCFQVHLPVLLKVKRIGLIVIDSIAGLFRSESIKNLSVRSRQFSEIAKQLNILNDRGICVICVNQVTSNLQTGKIEPCLGISWSNLITCRFCITRNDYDCMRKFSVIFAPDLPCKSCNFFITKEGICDTREKTDNL